MTGKDSRSRKQKGARELTAPVNIGSDHIRGSINNAPITLVEYGDYECPYTGMAYPVVKEIKRNSFGYTLENLAEDGKFLWIYPDSRMPDIVTN
jgi:protein-disulfide isomerase